MKRMFRGLLLVLVLNIGVPSLVVNAKTPIIGITDRQQVVLEKWDGATYKSSNFEKEYIEIQAMDKNTLVIKGKTSTKDRHIIVEVKDNKDNICFEAYKPMQSDGKFEHTYHVSLPEGKCKINIYMNIQQYGVYESVYTDIPITQSEVSLTFERSPIYKHNIEQISKNNKILLADISLIFFSQKSKDKLSSITDSIIVGKTTDYDKVLAIAEWVSDNIYYDYDALNSGNFGRVDAIGTLEAKRSVCQGYAELTTALVRTAGIPARMTIGYALGIDENSTDWNKADHSQPNHAWNEVFIDGRWIIIDTTWNSKNRYEKGKYITNEKGYRYFDPTIEVFSDTHKIMKR